MKVLAVIGSPRKGSNTDTIVDEIVKGCKVMRHTSKKIYLYDHEISPCIDCRSCKHGDYVCTIEDGMQEIYPKIQEADLIIFGTPLYWYGRTGKMQLFMDRMRPFVANQRLKGKKGVVVTPSAEGPKVCRPLIEMFRMSFGHLGIEFAGEVLVKAYEKGEIRENPGELKKAYEFGLSL